MRRALAFVLLVAAAGGAALVVLRRRTAAQASGGAGSVDESLWLPVSLPSLDFDLGYIGGDAGAGTASGDGLLDTIMNAFTPRGIRNNNPGNVKISGSAWLGKVPLSQNTDGTFEQFDTPVHGLRVIAYLLLKYQRDKGKRTLRQLIEEPGGWAPAGSEGNPSTYGDFIARRLGVSETDVIDLWTGATLQNVVTAVVQFENGQQPYPPELIAQACDSARRALS